MLSIAVSQKGFTLVELMIAGTLSLVALSAIITVYGATAQHTTSQMARADLRQQLYTLSELIAADIRRSGYWAFDPLIVSPDENPFEQPENRLRSGKLDGEADASCLLFSYDLDSDGRVGKGQCRRAGCNIESDDDNVEQFGFRLNGGRIQVRFGGTELSCNSGNWQAVTTPGIVIDTLTFSLHSNCLNLKEQQSPCVSEDPALVRRAVEFDVTAHLTRDEAVTLNLSRWIDLRNAQLLGQLE